MAMPDVAYFGQKDAQQVVVIRRLVADLNLPVRIEVCPTVREPDGLAMSSRNALLSAGERARALALPAALDAAARARRRRASARRGALLEAARAGDARGRRRARVRGARRPRHARAARDARRDRALLAIAARIGEVRLIDNAMLEPAAAASRHVDRPRGEALA